MKTFKQYLKEDSDEFLTDVSEINEWLQRYAVEKFTIHFNGSVTVKGSVDLMGLGLDYIPVNFEYVHGFFDCDDNHLTSLKGCPRFVGEYFSCQSNKIDSLEHSPRIVSQGNYWCNGNEITSLVGISDLIKFSQGSFVTDFKKITQGGLGLLLIEGLTHVGEPGDVDELTQQWKIIQKYLGQPDNIFACQAELLDAGFEEFTEL